MGEPKDDERLKALVRQARDASKEADVMSHRLLASTVDLKVEPVGNEIIKGAAAQVMGRNPNRARCRFGCDDKLNELEGECECGAFRGTMALKDPLQVRNLEPPQPGGKLVWKTVRHTAVLRSQVYTSDMPPIWDFYWLQCPDCPECVPLFSTEKPWRRCEHLRNVEAKKGSALVYSGEATGFQPIQIHVRHILAEMGVIKQPKEGLDEYVQAVLRRLLQKWTEAVSRHPQSARELRKRSYDVAGDGPSWQTLWQDMTDMLANFLWGMLGPHGNEICLLYTSPSPRD